MKHGNLIGRGLWVALAVLAVICFHQEARGEFLAIQGNPLEIRANELGTLGVYRWQSGRLVQQYYGGDSGTGTGLFLNGTQLAFHSEVEPYFTPISNTMPDQWTIVTEMRAGATGLQMRLTVSYVNGSAYYRKVWKIVNAGTRSYTDLALVHGGDTYFAGDDSSRGHWDPDLGMVYLDNPNPAITGIMGFYGGQGSRADHYYEYYYDYVWEAIGSRQLPDTVLEEYHDAGYALEWDRSSLAPGETWTVEAFEKWTEAGFVQVIAPPDQTGRPGDTLTYRFVVQSFLDTEDTFALSLVSSGDWPVRLLSGTTVVVPAMGSAAVDAEVAIPGGAAAGVTDGLTLTATSRSDPSITNNDTVTTHVEGAPGVVSHTWVADVDGDGEAGVEDYHLAALPGIFPDRTDPLAVLGGEDGGYDPAEIRLLGFDTVSGQYTEYPQLSPVAPGRGYWLITARDRDIAVSGTPLAAGAPLAVRVLPGWNIVGYPFLQQGAWQMVTVRVDTGEGEIEVPVGDPANIWVEHQAWGYRHGYFPVNVETGFLQPWEAYWVRNMSAQAVDLVIPAATAAAGRSLAKSRRGGVSFVLRTPGSGLSDRTLFLGLDPAGSDGPDALDCLSPPSISPEAPRIYVDHRDWRTRPGRYAVDVRPPGARPARFDLTLEAPARAAACFYLLEWQGVESLPPDFGGVLVDKGRGVAKKLGSRGSHWIVLPPGRTGYELAVVLGKNIPR